MDAFKVIVVDAHLTAHRNRLEAGLPDAAEVRWTTLDDPTLPAEITDADVFVGSRLPAELASVARRLRLVHVNGAGTDRIAFDALGPDVVVANTFHHEAAIAEYVIGAAVMMRRGLLTQDRALRTGRWATSVYDRTLRQPSTLAGARVGFVGFGHIGRCTWRLMQAFGAEGRAVTSSGRLDAHAEGLQWAQDSTHLDRLMSESELVVVGAPLTDETRGMIGAEQLRALGPDGLLINVGRGPLVAEGALYDALRSGALGAAALDVWYHHPGPDGYGAPADLPFDTLPNVLMTPHVSGVTANTFAGRADDIAANISRWSRGEPVRNVVAGHAPGPSATL